MLTSGYGIGLVLIVLNAVFQVLASVVAQNLYMGLEFREPLILTYCGAVVMFVFLFPLGCLSQCLFQVNTDQDSTKSNPEQSEKSNDEGIKSLTNAEHRYVAIRLAPLWFLSNLMLNTALSLTSITSVSVLTCTASIFAFLFAVLWRLERFTIFKFIGVMFGVWGSCMAAWSDMGATPAYAEDGDEKDAMWGDVAGLVAAFALGLYIFVLRVLSPSDEKRLSLQLVLAYIGLYNVIILSPVVAAYCLFRNVELTERIVAAMLLKVVLDHLLSDYLGGRAVLLTSVTVATVGLGLTIPLGIVSDLIIGQYDVLSVSSIVGMLAVLTGFVIVNSETMHETEEDSSTSGERAITKLPLIDDWQDEPSTSRSLVTSSASGGGSNLALQVSLSIAGIGGGPMECFTNQGADTDAAVEGVPVNIVYLIALTGFGVGAFNMYLYSTLLKDVIATTLVAVTSFSVLLLSPLLAIQKRRLIGLGDMRGQQSKLRHECTDVASENKLISKSMTSLKGHAKMLDDTIENKLTKVEKASGMNVGRFKALLDESVEVQIQIRKSLQRRVMQDIVSYVISSDRDSNFTLEENEKNILLARLRYMKGVEFHEQNYLKCIAKDEGELTVGDVMNILRNLMKDDIPEEDNIFRIDARAM